MSPVLQALVAAMFLCASVTAQPGTCTVTATNTINTLHIDGILMTPLPNNGAWRDPDTVPMDTHARLIAIRANNVIGGCSGIMAAAKDNPLGYQFASDNQWKCSSSAPAGWEQLGFDDSTWETAYQAGRNGEVVTGCPWIPIPEFPDTAYWIWTSRHFDGDMVVSCRGYTPVCEYDPCQNGGSCQQNARDLCQCPVRYSGRFCEIAINECDSNPCQNGGVCGLDDTGYTCNCNIGFTGTHCETDITDCASNPCQNGGTCNFDIDGGYTCSCSPGYEGNQCETDIDECASDPCLNNGTCNDQVNSVRCECLPGFGGIFCQNDIFECASSPCQNLGTCEDEINGYRCQCQPGYTGTHCETAVDGCTVNPCLNGGTCTLGGPGGDVQCICLPGWYGPLCASNEDECTSNPCQNMGSCIDGDGEYTCACSPTYTGHDCELIMPNCGSIMSQSMYPPSRNFWVLCEINVIDNPGHVSTPCRDLIVGINHYNDSDTILALGGSFGCFPSKFPDELSESACVPDYRMDAVLSDCLSCTHMGVCILEPPPK